MNPQPFRSDATYALQVMLREISFHYPVIPLLEPDGIFGERTLEAVMIFQRTFYPPVTGRVDAGTWEALVTQYRHALEIPAPPPSGATPPDQEFGILPEAYRAHADLIQAMYKATSRQLQNLGECPADGTCDSVTRQNTRVVQQAAGLPMTGVLD